MTLFIISLLWLGCFQSKESVDLLPLGCNHCLLTDENNFNYTSTLSIETMSLKSYSNFILDWQNLNLNIQGKEIEPIQDVDQVVLIILPSLTPEVIVDRLIQDQILQSDISLYVVCSPENAQCSLSDFGILGADIYIPEYFEEGQGVWLFALQHRDIAGAHSFAIIVPDDNSSQEEFHFTNQSSQLDVQVDFQSLSSIYLPESENDIIIDWKELTTDGLGNEIDPSRIDSLFLGQYDEDMETLEINFYDLENIAASLWTYDMPQNGQINLQDLKGDQPFEGLQKNKNYLLALYCSSCMNPAPRFVTELRVGR